VRFAGNKTGGQMTDRTHKLHGGADARHNPKDLAGKPREETKGGVTWKRGGPTLQKVGV